MAKVAGFLRTAAPLRTWLDQRVGPAPAVFEILPGALPVIVGPNAKAVR